MSYRCLSWAGDQGLVTMSDIPNLIKHFFFLFTPKKRSGGNSTWFGVTIRTTIIYWVPLGARVLPYIIPLTTTPQLLGQSWLQVSRQPTHGSLSKSRIVWAHVTKRRTKCVLRITGRVSGNSLSNRLQKLPLSFLLLFVFTCWSHFLLL